MPWMMIAIVAAAALAAAGWVVWNQAKRLRALRRDNAHLAETPLDLVSTADLITELQKRHDVSFIFTARQHGQARATFHGPAAGLLAAGEALNQTMHRIMRGEADYG